MNGWYGKMKWNEWMRFHKAYDSDQDELWFESLIVKIFHHSHLWFKSRDICDFNLISQIEIENWFLTFDSN